MARTPRETSEDITEMQWCIQECERSLSWGETSGNPYIQPEDTLRKQQELIKYKRRLQELMREEGEAH
jgi:hypothetical protein